MDRIQKEPFRDLPCRFSDLRKGDWFTFYGRTFVKTHDHSWFNCVSEKGMTTVVNHEDVVQPITNPFRAMEIGDTLLEIMEEALPGFTKLVEEKAAREEGAKPLTFADLEVGEWFVDEIGDLCQKAKPESDHPEDNCIVFRSDEDSGFCYDQQPHVLVTRVPNPLKGLL